MQNKDKELGDGVSKRLLEVYQEKTPKVSCECDVGRHSFIIICWEM